MGGFSFHAAGPEEGGGGRRWARLEVAGAGEDMCIGDMGEGPGAEVELRKGIKWK